MNEIHDLIILLMDIALHNNNTYENIQERISISNIDLLMSLLLNHQYITIQNNQYILTKNKDEYIISDIFLLYLNHMQCSKCQKYDNCNLTCFWNGLKETVIEYSQMYTLEDLINGYCFN